MSKYLVLYKKEDEYSDTMYVPIDKVVSYSVVGFKGNYSVSIMYGRDYIFNLDGIGSKKEADKILDNIFDCIEDDSARFIHVEKVE